MAKLPYYTREKIAKVLFSYFGPFESDEDEDEEPYEWDELDEEERSRYMDIVDEVLAIITDARKRKAPQMKP